MKPSESTQHQFLANFTYWPAGPQDFEGKKKKKRMVLFLVSRLTLKTRMIDHTRNPKKVPTEPKPDSRSSPEPKLDSTLGF